MSDITKWRKLITAFHHRSPYDFRVPRSHFSTNFEEFDSTLERWFELEAQVRDNPDAPLEPAPIPSDHFLSNSLQVLRLKWGRNHWNDSKLGAEMEKLPGTDALAAAYEYFGRASPHLLESIPHPRIAAYFEACASGTADIDQAFRAAISTLHSRKDRAYGASWKKRGERISILPNIARKVDRLESFAAIGSLLTDETVLDTVIDLYVYATKYLIFLEENETGGTPTVGTEHSVKFNRLVNHMRPNPGGLDLIPCIRQVVNQFAILWPKVEANAPLLERKELTERLAAAAWQLLESVKVAAPQQVNEFITKERSS